MTIGLLLINTGTPEAPTAPAVKKYLKEFLSDPRVIHLPKIFWLPILYGIILPFRSKASAKLYKNIWTAEGAPMRIHMENIAHKLQATLNFPVSIGMNYDTPSIAKGIETLFQQSVSKIIFLPLYPQYSNTTTAASFDQIIKALKKQNTLPQFHFINHYYDHPLYIQALAAKIRKSWTESVRNHLLISFHGLPERFIQQGDIYASHCQTTATLLANELQLSANDWTLCYQSRFGYDKWLSPSTQTLLATLPQKGIEHLDVICPGFSVDCLETLEEIAIRGKEIFLEAGGHSLRYISALNDEEAHLNLLGSLIKTLISVKDSTK